MIGAVAGSPVRRRRRSRRQQRDIAEAVLGAAERLLAERSLEDLTVAHLLDAAGTSRASFYFYFESKQAVVAALLERIVDQVYDAALPWLERSDQPPEAALRAAIGDSLALWREHAAVFRATADSWQAVPEMRELWGGVIGRFAEAGAHQIERERRAGIAPEGPDAATLAGALVAMNERCFYFAVAGDPADDEQLVETLTSIWVKAIYG